MLTQEQLKARDGKLTASRVGVLMSGDDAKILQLWREMLGLEEPPNLYAVWPVRLGEATEELNIAWYCEKNFVSVTRIGEVVIHKKLEWAACTLDGWDAKRECPVECKHVGGREPLETIIARYMPQMHWQMIVTEARECALSVIMGANEPIVEIVPFDEDYGKELMMRAQSFMLAVKTLTPPVAMKPAEPPVPAVKEYDMGGDVEWKSLADLWVQSHGAAETARECEKSIKLLVPQDARKAFGAGIVVTRNRAGSMALREMKE